MSIAFFLSADSSFTLTSSCFCYVNRYIFQVDCLLFFMLNLVSTLSHQHSWSSLFPGRASATSTDAVFALVPSSSRMSILEWSVSMMQSESGPNLVDFILHASVYP